MAFTPDGGKWWEMVGNGGKKQWQFFLSTS
jgi:hypothetical protein